MHSQEGIHVFNRDELSKLMFIDSIRCFLFTEHLIFCLSIPNLEYIDIWQYKLW